jgi:pyruvate,orthophosphate dikinase
MYADVVMGLDHEVFEEILEDEKARLGHELDTDVSADEWREIIARYMTTIEEELGKPFPQDPHQQLWGAIGAVFASWMNARAITYRNSTTSRLPGAPRSMCRPWCSAIWATSPPPAWPSPAIHRPAQRNFYGEFLVNAQGEDVVAGIRTPQSITEAARIEAGSDRPSLEKLMPDAFAEFLAICDRLENHYRDMQDLEFTIENGKLWMLQTRSGKRTAKAALKIAVDMAGEGLISREEAVMRIDPALARPASAPDHRSACGPRRHRLGTSGVARRRHRRDRVHLRGSRRSREGGPQGHPGAGRNQPGRHSRHARRRRHLTSRGGMTSHAAVVARGMGTPCVSGAGGLRIDARNGTLVSAWRNAEGRRRHHP